MLLKEYDLIKIPEEKFKPKPPKDASKFIPDKSY